MARFFRRANGSHRRRWQKEEEEEYSYSASSQSEEDGSDWEDDDYDYDDDDDSSSEEDVTTVTSYPSSSAESERYWTDDDEDEDSQGSSSHHNKRGFRFFRKLRRNKSSRSRKWASNRSMSDSSYCSNSDEDEDDTDAAEHLKAELEGLGYNLNCESFITKGSSSMDDAKERYAGASSPKKTSKKSSKQNKNKGFLRFKSRRPSKLLLTAVAEDSREGSSKDDTDSKSEATWDAGSKDMPTLKSEENKRSGGKSDWSTMKGRGDASQMTNTSSKLVGSHQPRRFSRAIHKKTSGSFSPSVASRQGQEELAERNLSGTRMATKSASPKKKARKFFATPQANEELHKRSTRRATKKNFSGSSSKTMDLVDKLMRERRPLSPIECFLQHDKAVALAPGGVDEDDAELLKILSVRAQPADRLPPPPPKSSRSLVDAEARQTLVIEGMSVVMGTSSNEDYEKETRKTSHDEQHILPAKKTNANPVLAKEPSIVPNEKEKLPLESICMDRKDFNVKRFLPFLSIGKKDPRINKLIEASTLSPAAIDHAGSGESFETGPRQQLRSFELEDTGVKMVPSSNGLAIRRDDDGQLIASAGKLDIKTAIATPSDADCVKSALSPRSPLDSVRAFVGSWFSENPKGPAFFETTYETESVEPGQIEVTYNRDLCLVNSDLRPVAKLEEKSARRQRPWSPHKRDSIDKPAVIEVPKTPITRLQPVECFKGKGDEEPTFRTIVQPQHSLEVTRLPKTRIRLLSRFKKNQNSALSQIPENDSSKSRDQAGLNAVESSATKDHAICSVVTSISKTSKADSTDPVDKETSEPASKKVEGDNKSRSSTRSSTNKHAPKLASNMVDLVGALFEGDWTEKPATTKSKTLWNDLMKLDVMGSLDWTKDNNESNPDTDTLVPVSPTPENTRDASKVLQEQAGFPLKESTCKPNQALHEQAGPLLMESNRKLNTVLHEPVGSPLMENNRKPNTPSSAKKTSGDPSEAILSKDLGDEPSENVPPPKSISTTVKKRSLFGKRRNPTKTKNVLPPIVHKLSTGVSTPEKKTTFAVEYNDDNDAVAQQAEERLTLAADIKVSGVKGSLNKDTMHALSNMKATRNKKKRHPGARLLRQKSQLKKIEEEGPLEDLAHTPPIKNASSPTSFPHGATRLNNDPVPSMLSTSTADTWAEIANASMIVEKALERLDSCKSEDLEDQTKLHLLFSQSDDDQSISGIEKALETLRKHASRLGVKETDFLMALDSTDTESLGEETYKSYKSVSLAQEIFSVMSDYMKVGQ